MWMLICFVVLASSAFAGPAGHSVAISTQENMHVPQQSARARGETHYNRYQQNGYNGYQQNGYNENSIQTQFRCRPQRCPANCKTYVGQDGCTYCGPCQYFPQQHEQRRCPPVNCRSYPGMKCYTTTDYNGCKTCRCEKIPEPNQACPIPMCSSNCKLGLNAKGCYHCYCQEKRDCPPVTCDRNCDRYRGPDGCEHCDCAKVSECPEVKCDFSICRHKIDFNTGCAVGCECRQQPRNAGYGLRTIPR